MQINWRLKSLLFGVFDIIGERPLYWVQKHVTGRSRVVIRDIPLYWRFHAETIARYGSRNLIEFGAGKSLSQNLFLSRPELHQTVVDLNAMIDLSQVNDAIRILHEMGARPASQPVSNLEELEAIYAIRYLAPFDMRATGFLAGSYDLCISTNTLEHIPADSIRRIFSELRRVLVSGGVVSAVIGYSDHYAHTDSRITPLNYLRFTEQQWRRYNHDCHYQNRLRHRHYLDLFQQVGFNVVLSRATDYSSDVPGDLHPSTLTGDATDYALTGDWILENP